MDKPLPRTAILQDQAKHRKDQRKLSIMANGNPNTARAFGEVYLLKTEHAPK